jgi:hypothetical protein
VSELEVSEKIFYIHSINYQMPKVVDNYVLERKIGSGQFGEVSKGYNRTNN